MLDGIFLSFLFLFHGTLIDKNRAILFLRIGTTDSGIASRSLIMNSTKYFILNYLYYYNGAGLPAANFNNDLRIC